MPPLTTTDIHPVRITAVLRWLRAVIFVSVAAGKRLLAQLPYSRPGRHSALRSNGSRSREQDCACEKGPYGIDEQDVEPVISLHAEETTPGQVSPTADED